MTLLEFVTERLRRGDVRFALIGGGAVNVHGVQRNTFDTDLLVSDARVLREGFWAPVPEAFELRISPGDADDPLAGIVRVVESELSRVDVVLGRYLWQSETIDRAVARSIRGVELPVVEAADLVLLKLYSGGPQDLSDIARVLASSADGDLKERIEGRLSRLPGSAQLSWRRLFDLYPGS